MKLSLFQIDAFTNKLFGGNPAAVIPLKKWMPTELLQQVALENNLSETVYIAPSKNKKADYDIRWFTPAVEVNLCGHATLAAAYVIFNILKWKKNTVVFDSQSGLLKVAKVKKMLVMDFPSWPPAAVDVSWDALSYLLGGAEIKAVTRSRDLIIELENEEAVVKCQPDFSAMKRQGGMYIITAKGDKADFVSRFFAPAAGIDEDPVTGSAHSQLIPYWSEKLNKKKMKAIQLSSRVGMLACEQLNAERVLIGGECVYYMEAVIKL